jgi:imidazolonepropionase-like amidohydrolase
MGKLAVLILFPLLSIFSQTLRYAILANGSPAGSEIDTYTADGHVTCSFEFNDRGRGPKITAAYVLGPDGMPRHTEITGVDYLKAPVNEHFVVENGSAEWKSTSETGRTSGPGFYVSINGPMAEMAFLAGALSKIKNNHIRLFPAGEAQLDRLLDTTAESHGRKVHITEFAMTGLSFEPMPIWLDDDGRFFAAPSKWMAILREGWEDTNEHLYNLQQKAADARLARLATELARHPTRPIAVEHVRVFDAERATTRDDQTVVVQGERIAAVGAAASVVVPANAQRIDGRGKTLVPGLFDMHAHVQPIDGLLNMASGVTSVRDMGNDIDDLSRLQLQWDEGTAVGPRVWKAGFIDGRGPFQAPTGLYADTAEEVIGAAKRYSGLGYVQIKLYSSLKPELVAVAAKAAHESGMRLSGHVPNGMIARQFVEAGADELQHINFIFLNFLADKVKDTRTPERFTAVGEYAAGLDLQSQPVQDFIRLLLAKHTTLDVTLVAFEGMYLGRPGKVSPDFAPILSRLPAQVARAAYTGGLPVTSNNNQTYRDSYNAMLRMTKAMYDAGVPILAGTDSTAGIMLHRELELEVEAGIPARKALQIATINAARILKQDADLGSINPGKRADWLLVDGNPAERISDIRRGKFVMKNGILYSTSDAYRAAGILPSE